MNFADWSLAELLRRRAAAARKVAAGALAPAAAEAHLRPWLALAVRAGADVGEFAPGLMEDVAALRLPREGGGPGYSEGEARAIVADDICHRTRIAEALGAARDSALDRLDAALAAPPAIERTRWFDRLARAFGAAPVPFVHPAKEAIR